MNKTSIACLNAALEKQGPVHLNLPFEEPLYGAAKKSIELQTVTAPSLEKSQPLESATIEKWQSTSKKMILVGTLPPGGLSAETVAFIAADPSITVLCESTSNLSHFSFLSSVDVFIAPP